mmetsp:Transcript_32369/g.78969  ORF Transcript_32369/g.78969 Transcript_32369/m.78969 type:complete len:86 (-) Transcript_32369:779-1036(-)
MKLLGTLLFADAADDGDDSEEVEGKEAGDEEGRLTSHHDIPSPDTSEGNGRLREAYGRLVEECNRFRREIDRLHEAQIKLSSIGS